MGLSGLEIYKHLPKTNCKDCGFPTCLAFAMQLAAKKVSLDKCPHVSQEAKGALESASQPPIKLVTIGEGENKLEVGNETVMFRHEETFYHPTGIGFLISDTESPQEQEAKLEAINKLKFERVGQEIAVNLVALECKSNDGEKFKSLVGKALSKTKLGFVLVSQDAAVLEKVAPSCKDRKPLLYAADDKNFEAMAKISKENSLPLAVKHNELADLAELSKKIQSLGAADLVLDPGEERLPQRIEELTQIRRSALKKAFRPFGFPTIAFIRSQDPYEEVIEAGTLLAKYASIIIMRGTQPWQVLPLLTERQNIFTDPQKPLQVEPKIYEVGNVNKQSPVIVTTNFSLTYYTVESEVEGSKVPSYIISIDSEGMSVLTAWAAEKFTPEKISKALKEGGIKDKVSHTEVIIPGYVAVMSGKLEEESGWKVLVGPKEASGLPAYLKGLKK